MAHIAALVLLCLVHGSRALSCNECSTVTVSAFVSAQTLYSKDNNDEEHALPAITVHIGGGQGRWVLGLYYPTRELYMQLWRGEQLLTEARSIQRLYARQWHHVIGQALIVKDRVQYHVFLDSKLVAGSSLRLIDVQNVTDFSTSASLFDKRKYYPMQFGVAGMRFWPKLLSFESVQRILAEINMDSLTFISSPTGLNTTISTRTLIDSLMEGRTCDNSFFAAGCQGFPATLLENATVFVWCEGYEQPDPFLWTLECSPQVLHERLSSLNVALGPSSTLLVPLRLDEYAAWNATALHVPGDGLLHVFQIPTNATFGEAANGCRGRAGTDLIIFLSSHVIYRQDSLRALADAVAAAVVDTVVGGIISLPDGKIFHAGYEMLDVAIDGVPMLLQHHRLRGYTIHDDRISQQETIWAISRLSMAMKQSLFDKLGGFDSKTSPMFEDVDFCLRATTQGGRVLVTASAAGVSSLSLSLLDHGNVQYMSETFDVARMSPAARGAMLQFTQRWEAPMRLTQEAARVSNLTFVWVIHCGGSQGYEAATILQELRKLVDIRAIVRRYRDCEHTDTLSHMPGYFRDVLESAALKPSPSSIQGVQRKSVALYARDYREIGRWTPYNVQYVIGRYMFEANTLPKAWSSHCNRLDEIWVPSVWQKDGFVTSGVDATKIRIMHEAVDVHLFDPEIVRPLALPRTRLDGFQRDDRTRPYTFLSLYKMEDRKGWRLLIEAYVREFAGDGNVVLLLRTYLHRAGESGDVHDKGEIYKQMNDYLSLLPDMPPNASWPAIDVISEHLSSELLPGLYKACDAFVLPTHGEGWGLPTHEAMAMGLPVITTNWGGSTEFVREQWGYLIELDGLTDTSASDPWLRGFKWAKPRLDHLRQLMRQVYSNREDAQKMGARARRAVLERFSPVVVANQYAKRLTEIERTVPLVASHGEQVLASFDRKWGLTARFKACSVSQRLVRRPMRRNDSALCDMILVTTFPPRECGIATFAEALLKGLQSICPRGSRLEVLVVKHQDDPISSYNSTLVKTAIREFEAYDYTHAAEYINNNSFRSVLLQFEYGIFPGASILCFAKAVQAPLITTLHTVARSTSEEFHSMMQQFALLSNKIVVMTKRMRWALEVFHAIPPTDVAVIPHGVPELPLHRTQGTAEQTHFRGNKLILSNGLLHAGKGIEYVIRAIPAVLRAHPEAVYFVQGKPHPAGWKVKEYYNELLELVETLGLQANVAFNDTFMPNPELYALLQSTHVYVNAYVDMTQSVSGTLAMALGAGTACVSTAYPYAAELLSEGAGLLVPVRDSQALADAIIHLLDDPRRIAELNVRAYELSRSMSWTAVAQQYVDLATR